MCIQIKKHENPEGRQFNWRLKTDLSTVQGQSGLVNLEENSLQHTTPSTAQVKRTAFSYATA
jgi:hypothetical protein